MSMTLYMTRQVISILTVFLLLTVISCNAELESEIDWKLDDYNDLLVVEALITNITETQHIFLSKTGPYLVNLPAEPVSDAIITVSDGFQTYTFTENEVNKGEYTSDRRFRGFPFSNYELHIKLAEPLNNQAEYTAKAVMPDGIDLDTIICEIYPMPDFGFDAGDEDRDTTILSISYYGKEPDNPNNYYLSVISGSGFRGEKDIYDLIRFTDDQNNGSESDFILFVQNVGHGDTINFEIISVERGYYDFIGNIQQMNQAGSAYSMSGPPANAEGNIPGALGYFHASYISRKHGIARMK